MPSQKKKRSLKKRLKRFFYFNLGPPLVYFLSRLAIVTSIGIDINVKEMLELLRRKESFIVALWHNRALLMPALFDLFGGRDILVMVSRSEDGIFTSRVLRLFGIRSAFGSSTRGGKEAFQEMVKEYQSRGATLAITPDGPLGPNQVAKPGVVLLAKETGLPIYPVTYYAKRVTRVKSWDKFIIVHPFNWITIMVGEPIYVPKDASESELEEYRKKVEDELNRISYICENYFQNPDLANSYQVYNTYVPPFTRKIFWFLKKDAE